MTRPRAIFWTFSAIALIAAAAWFFAPGDPAARAASAAQSGRWSEALSRIEAHLKRRPNDVPARRLKALALARLGRDADARAEYAAIGAGRMTAADFLALAVGLEKDGREALTWLALEAASRFDPKDGSVRAAMADLRPRIARKGAVAHVTEHLAAVPTGPVLGELVVALAAWSKDDSSDDPVFDRVMARDRATLHALGSTDAVRLMIARILLETDHLGDVLPLLARLERPSPEAAWLRSRAFLQMKKLDEASAALDEAGAFAQADPHLPEPARYVGAKACAGCHPKEYAAEQSSRHATTLSQLADMRKVLIPDGPVVDPVDPNVTHTFTREGDKVRVAAKVGNVTYTALMSHALGSGHRGVTMIGPDSKGLWRELRISQYSEKGLVWDVTSGFTPHPGDPSEYLGKGLSSAGVRECIHCHATRFRSLTDRTSPEAADRGIGCERCHGPGGNHVLAMNLGFRDPAIGRFSGATGPQRMTACHVCHASDGTFPPTDPQFIRFQSTTLPYSKCYVESKGKLDCMTCHDPHEKLETSAKVYEAKCLECHGPKTSKGEDTFRRVACPVNAKNDCLKCHMPTREDAVPHTSFTDHHIRVHREETGR